MKSEFFTSGCVERAYTYGKSGFIRDVFGKLYYFTEKSFTKRIKNLHEGDTVIFKPDKIKNEKTGDEQLFAAEVSFE